MPLSLQYSLRFRCYVALLRFGLTSHDAFALAQRVDLSRLNLN